MILSVSSRLFKDVVFPLVVALVVKLHLYPGFMPLTVGGISSYESYNCKKVSIRRLWMLGIVIFNLSNSVRRYNWSKYLVHSMDRVHLKIFRRSLWYDTLIICRTIQIFVDSFLPQYHIEHFSFAYKDCEYINPL